MHGFRFSAAKDGKQALAQMKENKPDIVITAIVLPEMDGFELCRQIKTDENLKDIPVILLTTLSEPQFVLQGLECGANNYIIKSQYKDNLVSSIHRVIQDAKTIGTVELGAGHDTSFEGREYNVPLNSKYILSFFLSSYNAATLTNLELARSMAKKMAEQAEITRQERLSTMSEVTSVLSHELKTPMASIRNTILNIDSKLTGRDLSMERSMGLIKRSITRCEKIIDGLLDFTQIRTQKMVEVDIDNWLGILLYEYDLPMYVKLDHELNSRAEVSIDDISFGIAMGNIIDNACQSMHEKRKFIKDDHDNISNLIVRIGVSGDRVYIIVKDTGMGLAKEHLDYVFDPLFSQKPAGVGLGLTVAKKILDEHNGLIEFKSVEGEGAEVSVSLPLIKDDPT